MSETGAGSVSPPAQPGVHALAERGSEATAARVRTFRLIATLEGVVTAAAGLAVVIGWVLGLPALTRILPGATTTDPVSAACLSAIGAALALAAGKPLTRRTTVVAVALAVGVSAVAVLALVQDALGLTEYVDLFGPDHGSLAGPAGGGRMAQMTAVCLLGLAAALVLTLRRRLRPAQAIAMLVATVGTAPMLGHVYGVGPLYGFGPFDTMGLPTAVLVVVAAGAALFQRPAEGYIAVFVGDTAGGVVVRRILPWAILAPHVVGALVVEGLRRDLYDGPVALAIVVVFVGTVGAALVFVQGEYLRDVDLRRGGAEESLRVAQEAHAERDRIEARLAASVRRTRRILETATDAYIAIDTGGQVTDWNHAATAVFGWSRDEALGQHLENLIIPPSEAAAHRAGITRFLSTGEAPILGQQLELEAVDRSGARIPVELTVWAEQDEEVLGFHAFVRDITTRKAAELSLRRLNADLGEFAAIAAHDLRSPLTSIRMQVDLVLAELDGDWGPEETGTWVARIGKTADRGVALIDDLLDYVSIGREPHAPAPVRLEVLAREVVDQQVAVAGRPVRCTIGPLPIVAGDEALLRQLLANLVGNAVKYVPADRVPEVRVDAVPGPGREHCVLRVSDNGDGFDSGEVEHVFEMFQRGRGSAGIPGTGIGLAICRRVAERHGGRIWIEPAADPGGPGSRVCVQLRLWSAAEAQPDPGRARGARTRHLGARRHAKN
jgi:PAS domain S-box-containing protein